MHLDKGSQQNLAMPTNRRSRTSADSNMIVKDDHHEDNQSLGLQIHSELDRFVDGVDDDVVDEGFVKEEIVGPKAFHSSFDDD